MPSPNVKSSILAKVIEYAQPYIAGPRLPLHSANMMEVVQEWYASFVVVDQDVLFELILATNHLFHKRF
eukprot:gene10220-7279_t